MIDKCLGADGVRAEADCTRPAAVECAVQSVCSLSARAIGTHATSFNLAAWERVNYGRQQCVVVSHVAEHSAACMSLRSWCCVAPHCVVLCSMLSLDISISTVALCGVPPNGRENVVDMVKGIA